AEHSFLLVIVSAHSLASLTFLTSDEFLDLKLQKKGVFQQTARSGDRQEEDRKGTTAEVSKR
ncbi:MAG: hypothetical protein WA603_22245, partial [Candidatus Acidiferrales bacterium]